jgi:hypothetical protein
VSIPERLAEPVSLFYSYSHTDESLRKKLEAHLSLLQHQGVIRGWHDRRIEAGAEWDGAISQNLDEAGIILLLVSAEFLASRYCRDVEINRAMERHKAGTARVIPVILRPVDWHSAPFGKLQALPKDGKPVTKWTNRDEAFVDVARGIREAVAKANEVSIGLSRGGEQIPPGRLLNPLSDREADDGHIDVLPTDAKQQDVPPGKSLVATFKEYLSDSKYRIKLNDLFMDELRTVHSQLSGEAFSANPSVQGSTAIKAEFKNRIKAYEDVVNKLQGMTALLGRWAGPDQTHMLKDMLTRLAELNTDQNGYRALLDLRWYPIMLLMYSGGIAALSADRYDNLASVLTAEVGVGYHGNDVNEVVLPAVDGMLEVQRTELFKTIPGHERHYSPESEYMFLALQPNLEDVLFLGKSYENLFDRFELFKALVYADLSDRLGHSAVLGLWGPPGRYAWKFTSRRADPNNPFSRLVLEAGRQIDAWPPLQAGLFDGSYKRFNDIATRFTEFLGKLQWF